MAGNPVFKKGDEVMIEVDADILQSMQKSFGKWSDDMALAINKVGKVTRVGGDLVTVKYSTGAEWSFYRHILSRQQHAGPGHLVRIMSDETTVRRLQKDHGEWIDPMRGALGQLGVVKSQFHTGDLRVRVGCTSWTMNPSVLEKVSEAELQTLKDKHKDDATYRPGDIVQIIPDESRVRSLQAGHGEWADQMKSALGFLGFVKRVYDDKDLRVKVKGQTWTVNPVAVAKVIPKKMETTGFSVGAKVRILADMDRVKELQRGHGEWVNQMEASLGRVGTIEKIFGSGDIRVKVMNGNWTFNARALSKVPLDCLDDDTNGYCAGDKVRIHENEAFIILKQQGHGEWVDQMNSIPGKVGQVEKTLSSGDVRVKVLGRIWTLNGVLLTKLPPIFEDDSKGFTVGENIRVIDDEEKVKELQENHGGWVDLMRMCLGRHGTVQHVYQSGDLRIKVQFMVWTFNPAAVERVSTVTNSGNASEISVGDKVRVSSSEAEVRAKQEGHGGYIDIMKMILGEVGVVESAFPNGDFKVKVMEIGWCLNPELLTKVSSDVNAAADKDVNQMMSELSKLAISSSPASLFTAAAQGKVAQVRQLLEQGKDVDEAFAGSTPLHVASYTGHTDIIRLLVQHKANLLSEDQDGDTPLHVAVHGNNPEACKLLIEAGTDPSVRNGKAHTPLNIAADKGFSRIVKLLLEKRADINSQDQHGSAPIHNAIKGKHEDVIRLLLDGGADIDIRNHKGFNPFHFAAFQGYAEGLKLFIEHYKQKDIDYRVDEKKQDGFTAMHITAFNNHVECLELLIMMGEADINTQNGLLQTPLHAAVSKGYMESIKVLVHAGCDINIGDKDMDTALHESVKKVTLKYLKSQAQALTGITGTGDDMQDMLLGAIGVLEDLPGMQFSDVTDEIAVFLAENGADITLKNDSDKSPVDLCQNDDILARMVSAAEDFRCKSPSTLSRSQQVSSLPTAEQDQRANAGITENQGYCETEIQRNIPSSQKNNTTDMQQRQIQGDPDDPMWQECMKLNDEYQKLKDQRTCPICMELDRNMIFNCGHATCGDCSQRIIECPICRVDIVTRIKYYA